MLKKATIEKRIKEEYDNFVFQGYTTAEISYMGTCLQKWALEQRIGPANLKPIKTEWPAGYEDCPGYHPCPCERVCIVCGAPSGKIGKGCIECKSCYSPGGEDPD